MDSEKIVNMTPKMKMGKSFFTLILVIAVIVVLALNSFVIVNAGQRGIVLQLGAVRPVVLSEGLHFKIPFVQNVVPVEVRVQKSQTEQTAASKDLQTV